MASPPLVLPGALYVGEDERARVLAQTGPAAGWFVPRGIQDWSSEVSVVVRDALTEDIRKATKIVMPEEQIPPAKMPLTLQAALKSPLIAVSSRITSKLVELGVRVHSVGIDRLTSSFFYIAEGGGEDMVSVSGDLVAAVAAMLGERADNAAIERAMDALADRLLRSLSRDRLSELSMELAAMLPRAAADGSGANDVDLDAFEKELGKLVAASEKYTAFAQDIASKLGDTYERKIDVPLFGEARKSSQGPFDLTIGDQKVTLATYERWIMSGPLTEPKAQPKAEPAKKAEAKPATSPAAASTSKIAAATPKPAEAKKAEPAKAEPKKETPKPAETKKAEPAKVEAKKAEPAKAEPANVEAKKAEPAKAEEKKPEPEAAPIQPMQIVAIGAPAPAEEPKPEPAKVEEKKAEEPKPEPAKVEEKKAEPAKVEAKKAEPAEAKKADEKKAEKTEKKAEKKADKKAEPAEAKKADEKKAEAKDDKKPSKAIEPAKSSSSITWVALLVLAAAAYGVWHFLLKH